MKKPGLIYKLLVTAMALILATGYSWGQTIVTQTFTTSSSFPVPAGVSSITVECWGGGGGGGFARATNRAAGGGGGGGAYSKSIIMVTPMSSIPYTIGTGGAGGTQGGTDATAGGTTSFNSTVPLAANGGGFGESMSVFGNGDGGIGGSGGAYSGGNGADGVSGSGGGGGGSSAGTASDGNPGVNTSGGSVSGGGDGGDGGNNTAGGAGTIPGGGGAGGHKNSNNRAGGAGAGGQIRITYTLPTVIGVSSSTANGTYNTGAIIAVTILFSENVTVTGFPQITLETGIVDRTVNYSSGSGTNTLTFNYTVQGGEISNDLDYVNTNSLAFNGGTIASSATGNTADLTLPAPAAANSLGANKALVITDIVAPTVNTYSPADNALNVGINDNLVLTFGENVQAGTAGNITIYNSTGTVFESIPYNNARISFSTNTVTINPTATFATNAAYYVQITNNAIRDLAGNPYAGISIITTWNFTVPLPYYRSRATGNWNAAATWEISPDNVTWVAATSTPTDVNSGGILIQSAHNVTVTVNVQADDLTLDGTLTINATFILTVANGTANPDMTVTATGVVNNSGTITPTGTVAFNGTYTHSRDAGVIPSAIWNAGSVCNITGYTGTAPTGLGQSFKNFIFNCAARTLTLSGSLTIGSSLTIGAGTIAGAGQTINLTGNLFGTGALTFTTGTLNIAGNNTFSGTFTAGTGTVNYNGADQTVGAFTYNNLTISGGGTKSLAGNVIVGTAAAGVLNLNNGILDLGGFNIIVANNAAGAITGTYSASNLILTDGSGYLQKNGAAVANFQIVYPVGSGGYYSPMTITAIGTVTPTYIRVSAVPVAINPSYIIKYWDVTASIALNNTTATFQYDPAEANGASTSISYSPNSGTTWQSPPTSGTSSFGTNSFTITATNPFNGWWTMGYRTYFSYQTGDWNASSTWTSDPSGTTQLGNTVPGVNDMVVILSGRKVTLPVNVSSTGLNLTIEAGGFLDLATWQFTAGLSSLRGEGTIQISSSYFPTAATNTFINTGGGTTEYRTAINLPSQAVYNNLQIDATGIVIQTTDLTLNGDLHVKSGTFQINDNTSRRLKLTVKGDVIVDAGASVAVGTGVTNSTTNPLSITGGAAPFINYYDLQSHRIVLNGNFTNNGTVRFTNLAYPVFNAFPPTSGITAGFATVYFQGASDNTLLCGGITDFYNLVVDKGIDQTFKLTIYTSGSSYGNFRLFGANIAGGDGGGANPNLKKALWIRTGTLILEGLTMIPSLTEGTGAAEAPAANPNSNFYIPANGALVLNGVDVVVLSTSDDYREVNLAYNTTAPGNGAMGISAGGAGCSLSLYGKLQINNGFLSTRESGGIITSNVSPGQFILNNGTVDTKQFLGSTGSASYEQNGGLIILRGRFQRTPSAYSSVSNLVDVTASTLNNVRATSGISGTFGTFNLSNATNVFAMAGGTMRIYDVCGDGSVAAQQEAFDILSSPANCNVTGGTLELVPTTGSIPANDSPNFLITTNTSLGSLIINRASGASIVQLNTNPLVLYNNLTLTSGVFNTNNLDVTVGGDITIQAGTTYSPGTNTTILNGTSTQSFTVNLVSGLSLNKLTIDKPAGVVLNFAGTQKTINVADNFRLVLATLNDNGNTINLAKDCFNSGVHNGTGKIVLNGSAVTQTIDGEGIFNNLELNNTNAAGAPVSLSAGITINGLLNLVSNKIFNIGSYNLILTTSASVSATAFSNSCYIHTSGQSGDGGITKAYSSNTSFVFPLGCFSTLRPAVYAYTPATIGFSSSPATYGSVTVVPVGYEHPATTTVGNQSLNFYWKVKSTGFTGYNARVIHSFVYSSTDVAGTETNYIPSLYNRSDYSWNNGLASNINTGTNTISDWLSPANSTDFIDADYTAGDAAFGGTTKFYSRATGTWRANTTWSYTSGGAAVPAGAVAGVNYPGRNSIVIIENNNTVSFGTPANYLTASNTEINNCASLQIKSGATLDIRYNPGSNFGMVLSYPGGNGNFRITTAQGSGSTFTFPLGDFSEFNVNLGTTELYSTNSGSNTTYWLPNGIVSYGNLIISPLGGSNIIFPNNNLTIFGDLIMKGQNADSWFCPTWSGNYPLAPTARISKTITVIGDFDIQGGSFGWNGGGGGGSQDIIVNGDVIVAPGAGIDVWNSNTSQSMRIGGSLINNTTNVTVPLTTTLSYVNLALVPVTFFGATDAFITNTSGTPRTDFGSVTVNKGTSQTTTLTLNIANILNTPANNWLTLQNGTFLYTRTNPSADFSISTTTSFIIPSTAGLYIDYSNSGNRNILIANNGADASDLFLNGKLTVKNGKVYIGPVAFPNFGNDIEYSGGGASEIEITGGNLYVNGKISRNPSVSNGILKYTQSGGNITINGNAAVPNQANAKLEILNSGSSFKMSSGTLTIVKGGGTTFGDLYLRPETGSATGGDIIFAHNISGSNQQYLLDATITLNNLIVTGRIAATAASATVKLMVNPLVLNGNLTLTNAQSIFDANSVYNLPLTIKGDFTNNGAYNHYNNVTTFSGGTQSVLGTTATDFYDLNVTPVTKVILSRDITVNRNLSLGNGTLECAAFKVIVKGNVANNATYTNTVATGGLLLNGTTRQHITGTGTFGQIELNNLAGSTLDNSVTLNEDLILSNGIFDINQYLLSLGISSDIIANGTPFGVTKMVTSDGVWSNVGISKVFTSPLSTIFTYPLGNAFKYTPAILNITANGNVGSIRVNNINSRHPAVVDPTNVLQYYWEVEGTGISGLTGNLVLNYKISDVAGGPESNYVAAQLLKPSTNWSKAAAGPGTDNVDETNHRITFNFNNSSNITGEYTAGNDLAVPSIVPQYTSNSSGNWSDNTIWDYTGPLPAYPCPVGGPNGFIVTINHEVTANTNFCFAFQTTINNKLKVVTGLYGHNFGTVYGNGTLYLESAVFPAGRYATFLDCSGNGTIEYGGTGTYDINASLFSSIPRIIISGTGSRNLPDKDLTICKQLKIDDSGSGPLTLDNSIYNRTIIIKGTFERYNNGIFKSGTGPNARIEFAGSSAQTIGGILGNFTGINAFNNFEINNSSGLTINNSGSIEVNGNLLLTNGLITTTSTNKLTLNNFSVSCVFPDGGSAASYIDGPLTKKLNQGDPLFRFPVGKKAVGLGNNLSLRATQTGTLFWVVEYFSPNNPYSFAAPLTAVNTKEYWNVSGVPSTSQSYIDLKWNTTSALTPLMTQNGISDMRVAEHNGSDWIEIASGAVSGSDNNNGSAETSNRAVITSGSRNYTLACVNTPKPTIRLMPAGPICGVGVIPVTLTTSLPIVSPFTVYYTENGIAKSISPASFPASIPTIATGATYILTGFTYNYPAGNTMNGVVDPGPVVVFALPTTSDAGPDQSLCGATTTTLAGNQPSTGTGLWSIISGAGGTLVAPTSRTSDFNGTNGSSYTLRWTITNGTCISFDEVIVSFPLLPIVPQPFITSSPTVCQGQTAVTYAVPPDPSVTHAWSYSGTGVIINGTGNSVTLDFDISATTGSLSVTATNACGTSAGRNLVITVSPVAIATFSYDGTPYCPTASNPFPTFSGGGFAGTFSSTAGLVFVSSATGQVNLSASTPGTYTVTNSIAASGGCLATIATSPITISSSLSWTGAVNTDWNLQGNWSCGYIPGPTTLITIPDVPNKPVLTAGLTGTVNNIIIDAGASLTVSGNTLQITGTITNNGTFDATNGVIEMNGSSAQVIGAGSFAGNTIKDLIINNVAGVTLSGPLDVTRVVLVSSGTLSSNGNLTLVSTVTGTALIDGSGAGTVTGNVTMQRYLPSGFGYKYFSSPFQTATVNEFSDDMVLDPYTVFKYDESRTSSGWITYDSPSTNPLIPFEGYAVNFGDVDITNTVDLSGTVNDGNFSISLYNHDNLYTEGFSLIGNPYPSPVDWNAAGWTKTNIDNALYYFKASNTDQYGGTYNTYINGISSDGAVNNIIPSMQGFLVHVTDGSFPVTGTLAMNNSVRITNQTHSFAKSLSVASIPLLRLTARFSDDPASADPAVIYFDEKATVDFDTQLDALKLLNTDLSVANLYSINSEGSKLSISAFPPLSDDFLQVPLGLKLNRDGIISFRISEIEASISGMRIYLTDTDSGIEQDLLPDKEYNLSLGTGEYNNRFFLNFSNITTGTEDNIQKNDLFSIYSSHRTLKAHIYILEGKGLLKIYNLTGQVLFISPVYQKGDYVFEPGLKEGIYIVTFTTGSRVITKKIFIQNR